MTNRMLSQEIQNGRLDSVFSIIYPKELQDIHRQRWLSLINTHRQRTGHTEPRLFSAPGRTELVGNHTDHNRGKVLAAAIQLDTIAAVSENDEYIAEVVSEGYPPVRVDLNHMGKVDSEEGRTEALVRGIANAIVQRNGSVKGFTATTTSRVLKGSGLSSSAALEILIGTIINEMFNAGRFTPLELAIMGQEAENRYFGKPSGLMDQIACAVGGAVSIDFSTVPEPAIQTVGVDFASYGYSMAVVDTQDDHADLTADYAAIPSEMALVAKHLGSSALGEIDQKIFFDAIPWLRDKVGERAILRAIHFFDENTRVDTMLEALKKQDIQAYLEGVRRSGDSSLCLLQNIFSTNRPQRQPISLALAMTKKFLGDDGACRVHGGGFAGTIQVFVPTHQFIDYTSYMEQFLGKGCVTELAVRSVAAKELKLTL